MLTVNCELIRLRCKTRLPKLQRHWPIRKARVRAGGRHIPNAAIPNIVTFVECCIFRETRSRYDQHFWHLVQMFLYVAKTCTISKKTIEVSLYILELFRLKQGRTYHLQTNILQKFLSLYRLPQNGKNFHKKIARKN